MTDIKVRNITKEGAQGAGPVSAPQPNRPQKKSSKSLTLIVMAVLLVGSLGAAVYFWQQSQDAKSNSTEEVAARNSEESKRIVTALDEILLTEREEDPLVARVDNPEALKKANPDFYKNVQQGDHLIVFTQRAVIYRESEKKIINIAPIVDTSKFKEAQTQKETE